MTRLDTPDGPITVHRSGACNLPAILAGDLRSLNVNVWSVCNDTR